MCPSRLRRSTQVVTESTAVLFDTETAGDGAATARGAAPRYRCSQPLNCHTIICDTCVGHLSLTCLYVMTWQGPGLVDS